MAVIVREQEWEVDTRLSDLDLSVAFLRQVGEAALRARESCSPLHPPTFAGTSAWAAGVLTLRLLAMPEGFRAADPGNFSMTINDAKRFYIVVATGDDHCGYRSGKEPSTKTPKGFKTQEAVRSQLSLFPDMPPAKAEQESDVTGYLGFWLLFNFRHREVHIELSAPSDIEGGKILGWHERNIIPKVTFDPDVTLIDPTDAPGGDGFAPDFDIPVKRIA